MGASAVTACKIGIFNTLGWMAYLWNGTLFFKRFTPRLGLPHADRYCNMEAYCNDRVFELETLGPLVDLAPGAHVEHVERWDLIPDLAMDISFDQVVQIIANYTLS